jgi:hypothetical protein
MRQGRMMDILRKSEVPHGSWKARLKYERYETIHLYQVSKSLISIGWWMDSQQPKFTKKE